jgi:hypothetical protein
MEGCPVEILEGTQSIAKFNTSDFHDVHVWLAVVRLHKVGSDALISWNDPDGKVAESQFVELVQSFSVKDWSLFSSS